MTNNGAVFIYPEVRNKNQIQFDNDFFYIICSGRWQCQSPASYVVVDMLCIFVAIANHICPCEVNAQFCLHLVFQFLQSNTICFVSEGASNQVSW